MRSPRSSKCSNRKRRRHGMMVASSLSSPAEATIKGEPDHYNLLDVESSASFAGINRAYPLQGKPRQWVNARSGNIARKNESSVDRISGLPDDILTDIISRLTLTEAVSTSVLSTRWKYLWAFITVLNFFNLDWPTNFNEETLEDDRTWYVNLVNKVLQSHRGSSINEFKVAFHLDSSRESDITNWIYMAVLKRVQKFEMRFLSKDDMIYTITQECYDRLKSPCFLSCIKSLRSLCLDSVNVTGEILEFFIYNCPYLEELSVSHSFSLLRLKVVGSLLQLKNLHISYCCKLEELEISCPSLLSFRYTGRIIKYYIKNVPHLVDLSIGGGDFRQYGIGDMKVFGSTESYLPHLVTLRLEVVLNGGSNKFPKCELPGLRHLIIDVFARNCSNLLDITCMMESGPSLQKLTLTLFNIRGYSTEAKSRHQYHKCSHQHLKVVEVFGFTGNAMELELGHYLLENTTKLEKLLLIPYHHCSGVEVAREQAKKLEEVVPPGANLVFETCL